MQAEVVKVDVSPTASILIDQTHHDFFTDVPTKIDHNAAHRFAVGSVDLKECSTAILAYQFDTS